MSVIIDGKKIRDQLVQKLKHDIAEYSVKYTHDKKMSLKVPTLVIFQVGDREDSRAYIEQKKILAETIGINVIHTQFVETVRQADILKEIVAANNDSAIHGIVVQIPLPAHLDKDLLIETIEPKKDVDGLTSKNLKLLWENKPEGFIPATAKGIISLLDSYNLPIAGAKVVVIGRSSLVGKPTALALLNRDATVSLCHIHTKNLAAETATADILVVAIGNPKFITEKYVSPGQVIIDVGINSQLHMRGKKLVGDVDFDVVSTIVKAITPVPGGVGPMTVVSLFQNVFDAYKNLEQLQNIN